MTTTMARSGKPMGMAGAAKGEPSDVGGHEINTK